jgi:hypothetical protein
MAVQPVAGQTNHAENAASAATIAATLNGVKEGNAVAVFVFCINSSTVQSVKDDLGNTAKKSISFNWTADGAFLEHWIFPHAAGGNRTYTATFSPAATFRTIHVAEFSGVDASLPFGSTSSGTGTSTTPAAGSVTPRFDGSAVFATAAATSTAAPTAAAPYTSLVTEAVNFTTSEYLAQGTAAATNPGWTQGNLLWGAIATVLLPDTSSATIQPTRGLPGVGPRDRLGFLKAQVWDTTGAAAGLIAAAAVAIWAWVNPDPSTQQGAVSAAPIAAVSNWVANNPTVTLGPATASPAPAIATWVANSPTTSVGAVSATPASAVYTWVVLAASVTESNVTATPTPATNTWVANAPAVTLGGITASPAPAIFTWTALSGSGVLGNSPQTATPGPAISNWVALPGTVSLGGITASPAAAVATWTALSPATGTGATSGSPAPAISQWVALAGAAFSGAIDITLSGPGVQVLPDIVATQVLAPVTATQLLPDIVATQIPPAPLSTDAIVTPSAQQILPTIPATEAKP